uniref:Transmembrane protein 44 n=1 Tax=Chelonoidis abingdonii TaxID=106734 RepID=A0A8C0G8Y1_CHEAB
MPSPLLQHQDFPPQTAAPLCPPPLPLRPAPRPSPHLTPCPALHPSARPLVCPAPRLCPLPAPLCPALHPSARLRTPLPGLWSARPHVFLSPARAPPPGPVPDPLPGLAPRRPASGLSDPAPSPVPLFLASGLSAPGPHPSAWLCAPLPCLWSARPCAWPCAPLPGLRPAWKGWQEVSVLCIIYSFVGSMCNTIGALLAKQLAIQVFTGAYMAAVDIIHFLLTLFPVYSVSCAASPGRRKRRRRQVRSSLLALALPLCTGPGWYVLVMATSSSPEEFHGAQRRLLGTALQVTQLLLPGAILTFPCFLQCRGRLSPVTQHWASISSALASVLYAAAIVTHDQRPAYFMRAMPWLLLSLGSAALDVAITCLSCLMKSQMSQRLGLVAEATETPATWELLTQAEEEEEEEERTGTEEGKASPPRVSGPPAVPLDSTLVNPAPCYVQAGRGAVRLPGDGQMSAADPTLPEPPAYPPVQVIHAKLSPSSSSYVSSISSELEVGGYRWSSALDPVQTPASCLELGLRCLHWCTEHRAR